MSRFATLLVAWQRRHGRRGLPWQGTRDPYRIWLSEIMLQQTQVSAVIPYYERFLAKFPSVERLAGADEDEVLALWSGLGYYARARNLHAAARTIAREGFPGDASSIEKLPGVGRSTAAAIAVFAYGERAAILDGNVKRVLARCYGIDGWPGEKAVEAELWRRAERLLPRRDVETYTQALMDLGATLCTRTKPACERCPVARLCASRKNGLWSKIPAPRPRKRLPTKRVTWFIAARQGSVLLEKRPSPGVWGGLWCFPEKLVGCKLRERLPTLEHGFTHFRLVISPVLCEAPAKPACNGRWFTLAEARAAGLPAPVRRLVESRKQLGC
ncbi:MAG: A/G-specific adenine glycosylase [Betaproteobacteria bacterium]|nr:A/G-specific adenine glycosylase [Betaproteobacteria bacterium]